MNVHSGSTCSSQNLATRWGRRQWTSCGTSPGETSDTCRAWVDFKTVTLGERGQSERKRRLTIQVHLHTIPENANVTVPGSRPVRPGEAGGAGHRAIWGGGYVPNLDWGGGFIDTYLHQTYQIVQFKYRQLCSDPRWCLILFDSMDCGLPGSSVHGILQARILEWVAISFSRGSSWSRNWTWISYVSCIGRQILYH